METAIPEIPGNNSITSATYSQVKKKKMIQMIDAYIQTFINGYTEPTDRYIDRRGNVLKC